MAGLLVARRSRLLIGLFVGGALLSACGGDQSGESVGSTTSPVTLSSNPNTGTVAKPCAADQLAGKLNSALVPTGTVGYSVSVKNRSMTSCTLKGYPKLQMLSADGKFITTHIIHRSIFDMASTVVKSVTVTSGSSALFDLT